VERERKPGKKDLIPERLTVGQIQTVIKDQIQKLEVLQVEEEQRQGAHHQEELRQEKRPREERQQEKLLRKKLKRKQVEDSMLIPALFYRELLTETL